MPFELLYSVDFSCGLVTMPKRDKRRAEDKRHLSPCLPLRKDG